jgi:hypothetical protein
MPRVRMQAAATARAAFFEASAAMLMAVFFSNASMSVLALSELQRELQRRKICGGSEASEAGSEGAKEGPRDRGSGSKHPPRVLQFP